MATAGVNALLVPGTTAMTQAAGMLAVDGRCKALSAAADGYVRGEGCGAMLLRSLQVSILVISAGS